jgi:hypothetical protein
VSASVNGSPLLSRPNRKESQVEEEKGENKESVFLKLILKYKEMKI